ncbi:DUF4012 domain-containing protein [Micromonospora sp. BRA006-A]|nr:DUF4012 domain-containing protein [Micromonospora sp. BRA006-A]
MTQVRDAVVALRTELDQLGELTSAADRGARLLPPLLGADGPRTYLLVSQNPAELRATGGMFGAYAVLRAEGGRIRLVKQGSSSELGSFDPPLKVDEEAKRLWGELPGLYPADVNLTPDFRPPPRSAGRWCAAGPAPQWTGAGGGPGGPVVPARRGGSGERAGRAVAGRRHRGTDAAQ